MAHAAHKILSSFSVRSVVLSAVSVLAVLTAGPAVAQDQNQNQVETVVVTGTLLHKETPSPVTVISKEQIENSSLTTVSDVVRSVTADNSGTIPTAFTGGFAAGSSGVALRGLTVNSTLVLIDGLRTANYPLADDGQRGFVDLNTIPLDVVDRVDVFKDGASSIYGDDAIGGVVNIILKPGFQGEAGEAEVGTSQHGGGTMGRAAATFGTGDPSTDHYNAYINFEYEVDQVVRADQRGFPFNTQDLSSIGGFDLDWGDPATDTGSIYGSVAPGYFTVPGDVLTGLATGPSRPLRPCGPKSVQKNDGGNVYCQQNQALYFDDQPYESRFGVYARATFYPNAKTTGYLDASYFQNDVAADGAPAQIQTGTPNNTNNIALPPLLPTGQLNPNDPFAKSGEAAVINYAFGDIPSNSYYNNHVLRAVAGLQGSLWDWDYDAAVTSAHSWLGSSLTGLLNYNQLVADVVNGTYNFIDPAANSAATRQALSPPANKTSTTDLDEAVLRVNRDLWALPGGPLAVGAGVEGRYESTFDPDLNPNLEYQGLGVAHTIGHHTVFSLYGEALAPILPTLEADISGRYDHYSDFGGNFSPKAGAKWTPIDEFSLRGTYSEGFRAPSFAENGSSSSEGFITFTPPCSFVDEHGGVNCHGGDGYVQPYALALLAAANPAVRPETSRSFTLGSVVKPLSDSSFVVSLDYYNIRKDHLITQQDPSVAINDYFAGLPIPPGYMVTLDNPDTKYPKAPPRPLIIESLYVNANSLLTDGLDLDVTATAPLPISYPINWTSELNVTEILHYTVSFPGQAPQSYVGLQSPYILSSGAGTPRWRGSLSNTFSYEDLTLSGVLYYTSGINEYGEDIFGPNTTTLPFCLYPLGNNCRMSSFWDFDLTGRYKIDSNIEIFGAIKNLFDASPPVNPADYAGINYNPTYAQAGIIGRFFSIGVRVQY
ncbi:MAG TPA: TonB-dependent receptor [Rhizomicrobium sp.]|jgi:iron complex outermembrane receptor protein|nr:TonB-dependent receptor [Rhizomicrobium sp.]